MKGQWRRIGAKERRTAEYAKVATAIAARVKVDKTATTDLNSSLLDTFITNTFARNMKAFRTIMSRKLSSTGPHLQPHPLPTIVAAETIIVTKHIPVRQQVLEKSMAWESFAPQ